MSPQDVACIDCYSGYVTAKKVGTATITVTTVDGGYSASTTVKVLIDSVTIKVDEDSPTFNKVIFNSSGKVWYCINHDMIYDDAYRDDFLFTQRAYRNFWTYYNDEDVALSDRTPKEYTDDEIKLLYAIDPYGVADYVNRYAAELSGGLETTLQYKDRIFKLLFKREPKYFAREIDGSTWYETTDKSNLSKVQSESEWGETGGRFSRLLK